MKNKTEEKSVPDQVTEQIGKTFNNLTVLRLDGSKNMVRMVMCECKCGKEKSLPLKDVKSGRVKSCGCLSFAPRTKK